MLVCYSRLLLFCSVTLILLTTHLRAHTQEGVPVIVSEVRQQQIYRQVEITGSVTSPRVARLSPEISGLVKELYVDEGDVVMVGAPLLALDAELAKYSWQRARASQQQADAALKDSQRRLREAQQLAPQRSIAKTAVDALAAEVTEDQAVFDQSKAVSLYEQAVLSRHQIKAPFSGVISKKLTEQGEWVSQGQGVFELVATEKLRLDFAVAEDYIIGLSHDAIVHFSLSALPGSRFAGKVQTIVPVTDPGARTFLLRITAVEQGLPLMPGMSVQALLQLPDRAFNSGLNQQLSPPVAVGIVVPRDAILRYPDGRMAIWTVEQVDGVMLARENLVTIGQSFDGLVEVRSGLSGDARVVIQGNEALRDGQAVRILESR